MKNKITFEKALRLISCIAIMGAFLVIPAFADNDYARAGAQWVLDGLYWIALVVIVWQLFKNVAAKNITGAVIMGVLGALCIVLITKPEVLKAVGEKLLGILGLS